ARVVLVALCAMAVVLAHAAPAALHDACMLPERSAPAPGEAVRVSLHDSAVFPGPPVDWRPDLAREFFLVDAAGRLDLKDRVLEIIPEAQPAEVRPGGRLPVKVRFEGMPYPGGLLCATHSGLAAGTGPYAWCGRLDRDGRASVPIEAPGWQLLRTTRLRALAGDDRADWVSYWAALTFEVPSDRSPR